MEIIEVKESSRWLLPFLFYDRSNELFKLLLHPVYAHLIVIFVRSVPMLMPN